MSVTTTSIMRSLPFSFIVLTALFILPTRAQLPDPDQSVFGSSYVVAFPDVVTNTIDTRFPSPLTDRLFIYIYSSVGGNRVKVTAGLNNPSELTLKAGVFQAVELPADGYISQTGVPLNSTYRIDATYPVVVYCYISTRFGGEAWTPIPVESWGNEYYVAALPGKLVQNIYPGGSEDPGYRFSTAPAEVLIVAAYNNTHVTITPTGSVADSTALTNITLMANQVYQIQSRVDTSANVTQADIGGSHITSDRPIGVLSGNTRTQIFDGLNGITRNSYKNMLIEWLSPVEQHGTEFVYLPTVDSRSPLKDSTLPQSERRSSEFIRIYGTSPGKTTGSYFNPLSNAVDSFTVENNTFRELQFSSTTGAIRFRSNKPAQAIMHSAGVARYHDTSNYPGGKKGISYDTWSPYMAEATPREQWSCFAPFLAPQYPPSINHYIKVVADAASAGRIFYNQGSTNRGAEQPFLFNRGTIPGTDLIWGTMQIVAGVDYYLRGADSSAKFHGVVYGVRSGYEILRFTKQPEFEESAAISYGYPLAPSRNVLGIDDTMEIYTERIGCYDLAVRLHISNIKSAGLKQVTLAKDAVNTRIVLTKPGGAASVLGLNDLEFTVTPLDVNSAASATVIVRSRTGKYWTIPYSFTPTPATITPKDSLNFGSVRVGTEAYRQIVIRNPLQENLRVEGVQLLRPGGAFSIAGNGAIFPASIPPGDSIKISIRSTPLSEGNISDSVRITLKCSYRYLPVRIQGVRPCIQLNDLNFGTLKSDESKVLELMICNKGTGDFTLIDSTTKGVITWLPRNFSIAPADLVRLNQLVIPAGGCEPVNVTFQAKDSGLFQAVARLWADTRNCVDTSVWQAVVFGPPPVLDAPMGSHTRYALHGNTPNPFSRSTRIEYTLGAAGHTTIVIYDATGKKLTTLIDALQDAGSHRAIWEAAGVPSGLYYCRITSGDWSSAMVMMVAR